MIFASLSTLKINGSRFDSNAASSGGGAVYSSASIATVYGSKFISNSASVKY